jgi:putative tryptophan/tyrosine transport system substrate-binding protein
MALLRSLQATELATRAAGITLVSLPIRQVEDIKEAFERAAREQIHGLVVLSSPLVFNQRSQIADLALKARLPTISLFTSFPRAGVLMAYGQTWLRCSCERRVISIEFSGATPGALPIERPSKFELIINLKTAKDLGFDVPPTLVARADDVIE